MFSLYHLELRELIRLLLLNYRTSYLFLTFSLPIHRCHLDQDLTNAWIYGHKDNSMHSTIITAQRVLPVGVMFTQIVKARCLPNVYLITNSPAHVFACHACVPERRGTSAPALSSYIKAPKWEASWTGTQLNATPSPLKGSRVITAPREPAVRRSYYHTLVTAFLLTVFTEPCFTPGR